MLIRIKSYFNKIQKKSGIYFLHKSSASKLKFMQQTYFTVYDVYFYTTVAAAV